MNRDDLAKALFAIAEQRAKTHGMQLGHGADGDIRRFAETGADRILAQVPDVTALDPTVVNAQMAFEKLIDEMVRAATEVDGYSAANPNIIGEQTLARALSKLCPLFPIC